MFCAEVGARAARREGRGPEVWWRLGWRRRPGRLVAEAPERDEGGGWGFRLFFFCLRYTTKVWFCGGD